jgi:ParB family chromosome partitioning protein
VRWSVAKIHDLKCWPEYFKALVSGEKSFEFRKDDRDFSVGDKLFIEEWDPETERYTGAYVAFRVTYIACGSLIPDGFCVMSIVPIEKAGDRG